MTINLPVDAETERLARKLAETTGKALPTVVREAIESHAAAAGIALSPPPSRPRDELLARMLAITGEFARLPVLDARKADDIIGYDDHGAPQ